MSDPYRDLFAKDYLSSKDFARMYGVDTNRRLRFLSFGIREAKDPQNFQGPMLLKAIVHFVEHPNLPMFVNNTQHDYLLDRFGDNYWLSENRHLILHAPIICRCRTRGTGRKKMFIVDFLDMQADAISQWKPLDPKTVERMREAMKSYGINKDQFRSFVRFNYPELVEAFDDADGAEDLPRAFSLVFSEMCQEIKADLTHKPIQRDPEPEEPDEADQYDQGMDTPNFKTPAEQEEPPVRFTHDDIPF